MFYQSEAGELENYFEQLVALKSEPKELTMQVGTSLKYQ